MTREHAMHNIAEVFALYENYGQCDYIGEPVSQVEHMAQAAQLAESEGHEEDVVLAAFFHDIGHLCEYILPVKHMEGAGVAHHENIGAEFLLQKGFSEKIARLVQSHVPAKRYLTYKFPEYFDMLSSASKTTLQYQGGVMNEAEAQSFESDPLFPLYIKLREWDDRAKEKEKRIPSLDKYKKLALDHLIK